MRTAEPACSWFPIRARWAGQFNELGVFQPRDPVEPYSPEIHSSSTGVGWTCRIASGWRVIHGFAVNQILKRTNN